MRDLRAGGSALDRLLGEWLPSRGALGERFLPMLLGSGRGIAAVVFYGSCLQATGASDSEPDFYLIVDSLASYLPRRRHRLLGRILPPLTFHRRLDGDAGSGGWCKVCVLTAAQLSRETSSAAHDLHHLGRFSKHVGLIYARDSAARRLVHDAQRSALEVMADHALALLGERFGLDEFVLTWLGLSYRGEPRIVEPDKVERIFDADRETYRRLGRLLLRSRAAAEGELFWQPAPLTAQRQATLRLIARSRVRALLRWPKNMLTFEGWLEYAIRKVERHTGHRVALSSRARRHPLLFGWPELFALRRSGTLR